MLVSTFAPGGPSVPMDPALGEFFAGAPDVDWSDPGAVVDQQVGYQRALAARSVPFDEAGARALTARSLARTADVRASLTNHDVLRDDQEPWFDRLGEIRVPALVVQGAEDPMVRPPNAEALAGAIPGATLLLLPGVGHEFPRRVWDVVVPAILDLG